MIALSVMEHENLYKVKQSQSVCVCVCVLVSIVLIQILLLTHFLGNPLMYQCNNHVKIKCSSLLDHSIIFSYYGFHNIYFEIHDT